MNVKDYIKLLMNKINNQKQIKIIKKKYLY